MLSKLTENLIKIFITGANGCIGNVLVQHLADLGYKIIALALNNADIDKIKDIRNVNIVYGNICDKKRMEDIFSSLNFEIVIHLAAIVHRSDASKEEFMKVNYKGIINLFELSKNYGIKQFIFLSTVAVYGDETYKILDENSNINPSDCYGISKALAEKYIMEQSKSNIHYTIIRATTVYGKYDKGNINKLFSITKKRVVPIIGDGSNLKSFIYVENLIIGIIKAILNSDAYNQIFILSDKEPYSINKILLEMEKIIGKKILIIHFPSKITLFFLKVVNRVFKILIDKELFNISSIKKLKTNNVFNISKAKKILNYEPEYTLEEGLNKTYISEKYIQ